MKATTSNMRDRKAIMTNETNKPPAQVINVGTVKESEKAKEQKVKEVKTNG